ncbi:MAG: electron transfer flavoprotein subunit beta/FixA family protein [Bacteroidota bacterium]
MKILVCVSNVPDTTTKIRFSDPKTFDAAGVQWIINPWDELALTRAVEFRETIPAFVEKVTVINIGPALTEATLRKALAIGADDAIRVNQDPKDAYAVAFQIAEAIKNDGYDMILCGVESSDYNGFGVGGMLAELLDIPSLGAVSGLNINGSDVVVDRDIDGGKEVMNVQLPVLLVVQKGIAKDARIPSMRGIMTARTKPLVVKEATACEVYTEILSFDLPQAKAKCKMIDAENLPELVRVMHEEFKAF